MVPSPEPRGPDSDGVCSVCVRKFQKRDGAMETPQRLRKGEWSSFGACEASAITRKSSRLLGGASLFAPIYVSIWRGNKTAVGRKKRISHGLRSKRVN